MIQRQEVNWQQRKINTVKLELLLSLHLACFFQRMYLFIHCCLYLLQRRSQCLRLCSLTVSRRLPLAFRRHFGFVRLITSRLRKSQVEDFRQLKLHQMELFRSTLTWCDVLQLLIIWTLQEVEVMGWCDLWAAYCDFPSAFFGFKKKMLYKAKKNQKNRVTADYKWRHHYD